jgi:hypothetical protein
MPESFSSGRIESLRQVVLVFHDVKQSYAAALRRIPMPKCLPEGNDAETLRQRYNILAIRNPFYGTYRDRVGDYRTPGQLEAERFWAQFSEAHEHLAGHCRDYEKDEPILEEFDLNIARNKLSLLMVPDKYGISALLDVQIQSLVRRFSRLASHEQYLSLRIDVDLPGILREARQALKLNQGSAASKVGVPLATYKSWEARKHQPEPDNRDKVEGFIREALSRYAPTLS